MTVTPEDIMDEVINEAGGVTLADLRRASGKTQMQVAEAMGRARSWVSRIEMDYPNITVPVLQNYMAALGGSVHLVAAGRTVTYSQVVPDAGRADARKSRLARLRGEGRFV